MGILDQIAKLSGRVTESVAVTTHATPGTRVTVAHGLKDVQGLAITPTVYFAVETVANADGAITLANLGFVSVDSTNFVVRGDLASKTFTIFCA